MLDNTMASSPARTERETVDLRKENMNLAEQNASLQQQVSLLQQQMEEERQIYRHLQLPALLEGEGDRGVDVERVARRVAKALHQVTPCDLGLFWLYQAGEQRYKLLATTGSMAYLVPGNLQPDMEFPALHTALTNLDMTQASGLKINGQVFSTCLIAPLAAEDELRGLIMLASLNEQPFPSLAVRAVETAAAQLVTAWQMARPYEVLSDFIQAITSFSAVQETGSLMERIADTARTRLNARFAVVATQSQQEWRLRCSGSAPRVLAALQGQAWSFLEAAARSPYTFRIRDLRDDDRAAVIELDDENLRTLLCSPIRMNGLTTGLLLVFGKQAGQGFNEFDVFLAEKLAAHAAINLESCYLNQELRESLKTTRLLYDLGMEMAQADHLNEAAWLIARTAYRMYPARQCGLVLYGLDGQRKVAEACLPPGSTPSTNEKIIQQAMDTRQAILLSDDESGETTSLVVPVNSRRLCYGVLWMVLNGGPEVTLPPVEEIQALVSQAAIAVERMFLLQETRLQARELELANRTLRSQANELESALTELEASYDQTIQALTRALDARDRETENHSTRVTQMSVWLGEQMGLPVDQLKALRRGATLHDLGKLGIRDHVLLKPGQLTEEEWSQMRRHPEKGVEIIREIGPLGDAIPVIIAHQERWDGSGYPNHLRGEEIPLLARIFAVVDVYDALTSDRPYRTRSPKEEVLQYLESLAGVHFDPRIVDTFTRLMRSAPPVGEE